MSSSLILAHQGPLIIPDAGVALDVSAAIATHAAAGDPHAGYRLESADHNHQSTGLQGGQLDHGAAMVAGSLLDDDHTQYVLESALAYAAWSPSPSGYSVGNGTVTGRYSVAEKRVHAWLHFSLGSSSTVTNPLFALPVTPSASYVSGEEMIGVAYVRAAGTQHPGLVRLNGSDAQPLVINNSPATYSILSSLTGSVPATFTTGDDISINVRYEAA